MRPRWFFAGFVLGLLSLSALGATVRNDALAAGFVRFHMLIAATAGYFPTAREVATIVDPPGAVPPRVYVIVGGSSVMNGAGQSEEFVWTRRLQERLGPDFRVTNLAQLAGSATDFGSVAAEMLLRAGKPVIFVADGNHSSYANEPRYSFYRYMLFDAWHRGYLLPWAPRDAFLLRGPVDASPEIRNAAIGEWLDDALNFNDLWNDVRYNYADLQWNWLLSRRSFDAKQTLRDPAPGPDDQREIRYRGDMEANLAIAAGTIKRPIAHLLDQHRLTLQLTPPQLRAVTLVLLDLMSPYYLDRVGPDARQALLDRCLEHAGLLQADGFREALVPGVGFTEDDYVDLMHLSVTGGEKLADIVAPAVRRMAQDLEYLK